MSTKSLTIGEFITNTLEEFADLPPIKRIGYFFSSPAGPTILSSIFNNTTNIQEPSDSRLLYRKGSWVNIRFASYLYDNLSNEWFVPLYLENLLELCSPLSSVDTAKKESIERLLEFSISAAYNEVGVLALKSLFKFRDSKRQSIKESFKNLRENGKITEFSEARNLWYEILKLFRIDLFNASTFACNDLLSHLKDGKSLKK